jgi:hypothetical protein
METPWIRLCFSALLLLMAVMCVALPASAAGGEVTIAYRGSGGSYLGDTIVFDGRNTAGNTTVIKFTGPGLPSDGLPLYDLSGIPGSGNTAPVDANNYWLFAWDSSRIDTSKLQTARYTFTAYDLYNPEKKATTSLLLKKPEFYIMAKPQPAGMGDYVMIDGMAEKGVTYIKFDITDSAGTVLHTYIAPVSGTGSFNYGFHVDMKPGQYQVTGSNPSMKNNLGLVLTIIGPSATVPQEGQTVSATTQAALSPALAADTGSVSVSSAPADASVYLDSALKGKTPVTLDGVAPGNHVVEVRLDSYQSYSQNVEVKAGETAVVSATLQKALSQTGLATTTVMLALIVSGAAAVIYTGRKKN